MVIWFGRLMSIHLRIMTSTSPIDSLSQRIASQGLMWFCSSMGLPLVIIEPKNPIDEQISVDRLRINYKSTDKYPNLFHYNGILVISAGLEARADSLSAGFTRFMTWETTLRRQSSSPISLRVLDTSTNKLQWNPPLVMNQSEQVIKRQTIEKQALYGTCRTVGNCCLWPSLLAKSCK